MIADFGRPWQRFAAADAADAVVDFPSITITDNVDASRACDFNAGSCECTALVGTSSSSPQPVYPSTHGSGGTRFPVGTTTVACVATDAAGNRGAAATFAVEVACPTDYALKDWFGTWLCKGGSLL
jgi:hypothetical protein